MPMQIFLVAITLVALTIFTPPAVATPLAVRSQTFLSSHVSKQVEAASVKANKVIALRFAEEGWGTEPNWRMTWDELVADDVVYHFNSSPNPVVGLEANKVFNAALFDGFPDIHQTIETAIAQADEVVYRSTIQGTNTGEFLGVPPTGKPVKLNDFTLLKIADGKVTEWWYECNLLELMNQLGSA